MNKYSGNLTGTFISTVLTSGLAYLLIYLLITTVENRLYEVASFCIGVAVYLILRTLHTGNDELLKLLAKIYRILMWMVPLLLISITLIVIYIQMDGAPEFIKFYTGQSLFLKLFNIFSAIINLFIALVKLIYYVGIPLLIGVNVLIVVALVALFTRLKKLKRSAQSDFSLIKATLQAISPILIFTVLLIIYR